MVGNKDSSIFGTHKYRWHYLVQTVIITWNMYVMILQTSAIEGLSAGLPCQHLVIRISRGLGRFLMRGGLVPYKKNNGKVQYSVLVFPKEISHARFILK